MADASPTTPRTEKKDAILDAALELFAERGFDGTAVPEVARRAGVGAGTIYRYFDGKEALVNVVWRTHKGRLVHALTQDFPWDAPTREQFAAFWERASTWVRRNPLAFRFLELHHHAPYLDEQSLAIESQVEELVERFFEAATAAKVTKDYPPALLAAIVWGALVGLVRAEQLGHLELTREALEQAEQACWEAIRA